MLASSSITAANLKKRHPELHVERAFMRDEIEKKRSLIKIQKSHYRTLWSYVRTILSFFDLLRFCRYIAKIDNVKEKENLSKNERNLCLLRLQRFGNTANQTLRHWEAHRGCTPQLTACAPQTKIVPPQVKTVPERN